MYIAHYTPLLLNSTVYEQVYTHACVYKVMATSWQSDPTLTLVLCNACKMIRKGDTIQVHYSPASGVLLAQYAQVCVLAFEGNDCKNFKGCIVDTLFCNPRLY